VNRSQIFAGVESNLTTEPTEHTEPDQKHRKVSPSSRWCLLAEKVLDR
jgi:hypothetical protein